MPGAVLDTLKPLDQFGDVNAPRPGTFVTAVRDNLDDGPVRPSLQSLTNRTYWLQQGVVYGFRSLTSVYATKGGGGKATVPVPGEVYAEGNVTGLQDGLFENGELFADRVRARAYVETATVRCFYVLAYDSLQVGLQFVVGDPLLHIHNGFLRWAYTDNKISNPGRGETVANQLSAAHVLKYCIKAYIVAGRVLAQHGPGRYTVSIVDLGAGTRGQWRVRVTMDDPMLDTHYVPHVTIFGAAGGTLVPLTPEIPQDTLSTTAFDVVLWYQDNTVAPPVPRAANLSAATLQIGITVHGKQKS